MNKFMVFILFLLALATVAACDSGEKGCPEGQIKCDDGECYECCTDADCADHYPYGICTNDHQCTHIHCLFEGDDCSREWEDCCPNLVCDENFTRTCVPPCTTDQDCESRGHLPAQYDMVCQEGLCDCHKCSTDFDCHAGQVCYEGCCFGTGGCCGGEMRECVVLPASAVTRQGTTAQFAATPYLSSGAVAPGFSFTWSSSDTEVAQVADGLVTGGNATGPATITATVQGCASITCTAGVFNYNAVTAGHTRVVVVDELTQAVVVGATVLVGSEQPATTDENGSAEFPVELNAGNPQDITVSRPDYDYVTLKDVQVSDVIVHLYPLHHLDFSRDPPAKQAGGIKGKFDFSIIRCELPYVTCDVSIALSGLSIPPRLANLGRGMLSEGLIMAEVELGGGKEMLGLPAGSVFCMNQICFKEYCAPTGIPGNRVAWGLGGKMDLADLIDKLGPAYDARDGIDYGLLARGLLSLPTNIYTAMVPNVDVIPRPMVPDVNDIDGDPATSEVPDYDNFLPQDMTLKVGMDQTVTFTAPALPVGVYNGIILRGGLIIRGAGFVPLGFGVGVDSKDENDPPDGIIEEPIVLNTADVAGRIPEKQLQRVIIALAVKFEDGAGPQQWAGQVMFVDAFSGTHTLSEFMLPVDATYDAQARRLEVVQVPDGTDLLQAVFSGEDQSIWYVTAEEFTSFDLPAAPMEGDRSAELVGVYAVDLETGSYQDLVEFNDVNLGNLIEVVGSFSVRE